MQREIEPNEIDWVFCWRTSTGEVRPGLRDTGMNGRRVAYRPGAVHPEAGLRTIVRGRVRTCPRPVIGPRLDEQGVISRMSGFSWGHVTHPLLVPARDERELEVLRDAARAAVRSCDAREWSLAAIRAGRRECWAIHVAAPTAVVSELGRHIGAPWRLDIRETYVDMSAKGAEILCVDREGRALETLAADAVFDEAPLPAFASSWRSPIQADGALERSEGGGAVEVPYARPSGPGAWEKWVKAEERT